MTTLHGCCGSYGKHLDVLVPVLVFAWSVAIFSYTHQEVHQGGTPQDDMVFLQAYQTWVSSQNITSRGRSVHLSAKTVPTSIMPSHAMTPYKRKSLATKLIPYKEGQHLLGFQQGPHQVDIVGDYLKSWSRGCKGRRTLLVQVGGTKPPEDILHRASLAVVLAHLTDRVPIFYDTRNIEEGISQYRRAPLCDADASLCYVQDSSPCSPDDMGGFNLTKGERGSVVTLGDEAIEAIPGTGLSYGASRILLTGPAKHVSFMDQIEILKDLLIDLGYSGIAAVRQGSSGSTKALFHQAIGTIVAFVCRAMPKQDADFGMRMHKLGITRPYAAVHLPRTAIPRLLTNSKTAKRIMAFSAGIGTAVVVSNGKADSQWATLLKDKKVIEWDSISNRSEEGQGEEQLLGRLFVLARSNSLVLSTVESSEASLAMFLFHAFNGFSPRLVTLTGELLKLTGACYSSIPF